MRARFLKMPAVAALALMPALHACGEESTESEAMEKVEAAEPATPADDQAITSGSDSEPVLPVEGATPMEQRVATIGLLNKRNNVSTDLELRPGESAEEGPVIVHLEACERTAPYEFPSQTGAFVQVEIRGRGEREHSRIFSGWLFKDSPSLNVVEHPIYDVWVKDCAMSFPGDE